jgi:hypothetical protein
MNEDCSFNFSDTRSSTLPRSTGGSSVPTFSFRKDYEKFPFLRVVPKVYIEVIISSLIIFFENSIPYKMTTKIIRFSRFSIFLVEKC